MFDKNLRDLVNAADESRDRYLARAIPIVTGGSMALNYAVSNEKEVAVIEDAGWWNAHMIHRSGNFIVIGMRGNQARFGSGIDAGEVVAFTVTTDRPPEKERPTIIFHGVNFIGAKHLFHVIDANFILIDCTILDTLSSVFQGNAGLNAMQMFNGGNHAILHSRIINVVGEYADMQKQAGAGVISDTSSVERQVKNVRVEHCLIANVSNVPVVHWYGSPEGDFSKGIKGASFSHNIVINAPQMLWAYGVDGLDVDNNVFVWTPDFEPGVMRGRPIVDIQFCRNVSVRNNLFMVTGRISPPFYFRLMGIANDMQVGKMMGTNRWYGPQECEVEIADRKIGGRGLNRVAKWFDWPQEVEPRWDDDIERINTRDPEIIRKIVRDILLSLGHDWGDGNKYGPRMLEWDLIDTTKYMTDKPRMIGLGLADRISALERRIAIIERTVLSTR